MNKKTKIIFLLFMFVPFSVYAQSFPAFPMSFWGGASINGNPAPVGTAIRAYYDQILAGEVFVGETGIYGYTEPAKQKLIVGEGNGEIVFKFQSTTLNNGIETAGSQIQKEQSFISGTAVHKNLAFIFPTPTPTFTPDSTPTPTQTPAPSSGGGGGGGGDGGGGGGSVTITPTPTLTPTPTPTPVPGRVLGAATAIGDSANLVKYNLKEGDTVSAAGSNDPDVYIVNSFGYKRLFLNPIIFSFYGHLGGWSKIKKIISEARDAFPTSGLFRNCETNDPKVYAVEVTGEDTGVLHWVNMTGDQAVAQDPNFFKKVFCINNNEFSWYPKSSAEYTSLSQVPTYRR